MPKELYCDIDRFALALNDILDTTVKDVDESTMKAVKDGCKTAKKEIAKNDAKIGRGHYAKEFSYTTSRRRLISLGEVGNPKRPGLVHLLEKGHARVGGGRVRAFPHMAPAADVAFKVFEESLSEQVDGALSK